MNNITRYLIGEGRGGSTQTLKLDKISASERKIKTLHKRLYSPSWISAPLSRRTIIVVKKYSPTNGGHSYYKICEEITKSWVRLVSFNEEGGGKKNWNITRGLSNKEMYSTRMMRFSIQIRHIKAPLHIQYVHDDDDSKRVCWIKWRKNNNPTLQWRVQRERGNNAKNLGPSRQSKRSTHF